MSKSQVKKTNVKEVEKRREGYHLENHARCHDKAIKAALTSLELAAIGNVMTETKTEFGKMLGRNDLTYEDAATMFNPLIKRASQVCELLKVPSAEKRYRTKELGDGTVKQVRVYDTRPINLQLLAALRIVFGVDLNALVDKQLHQRDDPFKPIKESDGN